MRQVPEYLICVGFLVARTGCPQGVDLPGCPQPVKLTGPLGKRKRVMTKDGEMLEDDSLSSPSKRSRGVSKKQQQIEERIRKRQAEEDARKEKQRQV